MIYLYKNTINPVALIISKSVNKCSDFLFELINESTNDRIYLILDNLSNSIFKYDYFEIETDDNIPFKDFYNNESINILSGQYTVFVYPIDDIPQNSRECHNITLVYIKIFSTKLVMETEKLPEISKIKINIDDELI